MPLTGDGYLAGEYPGGTTTVEGVPTSATVRILYRPESGQAGDGALVAQVQSAPDGTWRVEGLRTDLLYDVVGRKEGFNDVIVAGVTPTSMVEITYAGAVVENETFTGAVGFLELVGGIPPYSATAETPLPSGLFPVVSGRNLIIDGTTGADEVASFDVKVTSSNGAEKIIPLQLVVGFEAPANFKAEIIVVDDVLSVSLTWEVTNSTQQVKVYRSATPFDMDDLPEPIATLSGTPTTYTDDDVIEADYFYYMVTAVCEQYELRSNVIAEDVRDGDPHWDNVVALLHFDGDFTDETGKVWTAQGTADISPANPLHGSYSLEIRGGAGNITTPSSLDFLFDADFTIEAFILTDAGSNHTPLIGYTASHNELLPLYLDNAASGRVFWKGSNAITNLTLPVGVWFHYALTRQEGTLRAFVNGILAGSAANGQAVGLSTGSVSLGGTYPKWYYQGWRGQLAELRITKGVARYTENFTPPTEPFPNK